MKVAILAGGTGTRLVEETIIKSKPMVEIGDRWLAPTAFRFGAEQSYSMGLFHR